MSQYQKVAAEQSESTVIDRFIAEVCQRLPVVERVLDVHGSGSVKEYLGWVGRTTGESVQPREDLAEVVYQYAAPLLGEKVALQAQKDLLEDPVVLTANHHGVDFFAQSVQGTLLFSQRKKADLGRPVVLVFACSNIPLDNVTYPRGALLYGSENGDLTEIPKRLPLFSNRVRRQSVAKVKGVDQAMLKQACKRIAQTASQGKVCNVGADTLIDILTQEYASPDVQQLDNYSDQAVKLNGRIWKNLFAEGEQVPELVYLDLEKVATQVLFSDLGNRFSLATKLLFDAQLRGRLLEELDCAKGCWQQAELQRRWTSRDERSGNSSFGCGTFMFWGLDVKGRRIPLQLIDNNGVAVLRGVDDNGAVWSIPLTAMELTQGLSDGRLMPSIFTCFLVIALARGITCAGGYYQAEYLPAMQQGVVNALNSFDGLKRSAELVAKVPTDSYLSGMQAVMWTDDRGGLLPAGPVEIIAGGRLCSEDIQKICNMSVRDAHMASLFETLADAASDLLSLEGWQQLLAQESMLRLGDRVVVKQRLPDNQ